MINLNDAPYSYARSAALLKYKVMNDCDLQIVALNAGTGKYENALGSLTVEYKGSSVRVGAGIPDALRRTMWENPDAYIGRVVTVQYFEETQDKTGKNPFVSPLSRSCARSEKPSLTHKPTPKNHFEGGSFHVEPEQKHH